MLVSKLELYIAKIRIIFSVELIRRLINKYEKFVVELKHNNFFVILKLFHFVAKMSSNNTVEAVREDLEMKTSDAVENVAERNSDYRRKVKSTPDYNVLIHS